MLLAVIFALWSGVASADDNNPVIGNPKAPKGGRIVIGRETYPKSLNLPVSGDLYSRLIYRLVVESLCQRNYQSGELVPLLAKRWQISDTKKVFTFYLDQRAKFSDGSAVTSKDVKAYWDLIHNPKNLVGATRANLSRFEKIEIVDNHTVKFFAKEVHYNNLEILCAINVTSHKFFLADGTDFNKSFSNKIFGSGPYLLKSVKKGKQVTVVRNKNYWASKLPQNIGRFNFDTVVFRTVEDDTVRFEMFKKGDLDFIEIDDPKRWKTQTNSDRFKKNWLIARRIDNLAPQGFAGMVINTRRPPLNDIRVRRALAHTLNRQKFIKDLFYGVFIRTASYWPNSIFANPTRKPIDFDLKAARKFLRQAGYNKVNSEGFLVKNGKVLRFEHLYSSKEQERYLTIWKNDLRKIGIDLKLTLLTWATLIKKWNNYEFDLSQLGWTSGLSPDPYPMWHSKFKDQPSGNNISGFSDPQLDKLIIESGKIFDRHERAKLFHKMDRILFNNHSWILRWYVPYLRIGYWNKFGFIPQAVPKYEGYALWDYVWYDQAKAKKLRKAMSKKQALVRDTGIRGPND